MLFKKQEIETEDEVLKPKTDQLKIEDLLEEIVDYYTKVEMKSLNLVQRNLKTKEIFLNEVRTYLKTKNLSDVIADEVIQRFQKYIWGYHVLEELINDDSISDIKVLSADNIRIKKLGKRSTSRVKFRSDNDYRQFVEYVAIKNSTNISDVNAVQNFTDKDSNDKFILRFNISSVFVNSENVPYLHIRKIAKEKRTLKDLIALKMLDQKTADYLIGRVENSSGILFAGKGASGKTTLMNALIEYIPKTCSGLVIQENEELFSKVHPDMMFQHVVTSKGEGRIQYPLKDLAKNGLLVDLDYFIIGEIKGNEALYFLNASYTGHKCWASVHGNSSTQAIDKLADYVKYESDYKKEEVLHMLSSLSVVVFLEDFRVKEISEISGWDKENENLSYKRIL